MTGEVFRKGRASLLIIHNSQGISLSRLGHYRPDKIRTIPAEEPRCTENQVDRAISADLIFPRKLGFSVNALRVRQVLFQIRILFEAVENIISAVVNQIGTDRRGASGEVPGTVAVYKEGLIGICLTIIDTCEGGGINDDLGLEFLRNGSTLLQVRDIDIRQIDPPDIVARLHRFHQIRAQHAMGSGNKNFHRISGFPEDLDFISVKGFVRVAGTFDRSM